MYITVYLEAKHSSVLVVTRPNYLGSAIYPSKTSDRKIT
jgi:hypothetical protein